jgi:pimeloyl-ACP methyl ester carboxylesterase|tara:strand:+ start:1074 stop:1823 length:750 start_codon:yes stop_codon:yes gene_type:complete
MNVIFVHGWACGWQDWCYISSILPDNIKVGIVKLRGSPDAVPLMGNISITECASDVITHADDLGFDNFILVGHSMGARIAIELAANYENRVTNLFLLDGSNLPENPKKAVSNLAKKIEQLGKIGWAKKTVKSMMVANLGENQKYNIEQRAAQYPTNVLKAYYYAMSEWDCNKFLMSADRLSCPVSILQSTTLDEHEVRQSVTTQSSSIWLNELRSRVPQSIITLVPNTGHFIMLEQPQLIAEQLLECIG